MTYVDEWRALSARIQSLIKASEIHAQHMQVNSGDPYGRSRRLIEHANSTLDAVDRFSDRHQRLLPIPVLGSLKKLLEQALPLVKDTSGSGRDDKATTAILLLGLFESEISLLLNDGRALIQSRCERAFEHLRRVLIVDPAQRRLWHAAHELNEPACEKLGATHLLHHGIWAFKVDAIGARTDLMYSEPVNLEHAARSDARLVLTEWKRAANASPSEQEVLQQFTAAREQAQRYAEGALAGLELKDCRYLVLVSRDDVTPPPDVTVDGVLYRHVNIPIEPSAPSKPRRQ
jgi:hypothetical protein